MRYLGQLKILLGRPRSRVPLGHRAARAAKNCCPNPALRKACPSALNLGCPISKSASVDSCSFQPAKEGLRCLIQVAYENMFVGDCIKKRLE
jgi:hypothetical protein